MERIKADGIYTIATVTRAGYGIAERHNAEAICTAVNNTYGKSINPEGVKPLFSAAHLVVSVLENWNKDGKYTNLIEHLKTAINKTKL